MKSRTFHTLCLLLTCSLIYGQTKQGTHPVPAQHTAPSKKLRIEGLRAKIDLIVSKSIVPMGPGISIGITYKGEPIISSHYGLMNLDYQMPASDSTAYNLASVSKHITAFGILLLESEGKLNLNDTIGKYVPNLLFKEKNITIRQLLHHASGIPSTDNLRLFGNIRSGSPWSMKDEIELLTRYTQLNFKPGAEFLYSNGGYSLLAAVVESASGENFAAFFKKKVFDPLGLISDTNNLPGKIIKNQARGYKPNLKSFETVFTEAETVPGPSNFYFNMKDMLLWMNFLMGEKPEHKIILAKMRTPSFTLSSGELLPYSYGLFIGKYKNVKRLSHSGGTTGFASYMTLFPEYDLGIAIMTNNEKIDVQGIALQITDSILSDYIKADVPVKRMAVKLREQQLEKWAGSYRMADQDLVKVIFSGGKLLIKFAESPDIQLPPESAGNFYIKEANVQMKFIEGTAYKAARLNIIEGKEVQTGMLINSRELNLPAPANILLIGSYEHPQLAITYQVTVENEQLILKLPSTFEDLLGFNQVKLTSIGGDVYRSDRLRIVEFSRNAKNEISGFKINDVGRIRNITFVKK